MTAQARRDSETWSDFESRLRGYVRRRAAPVAVDDIVGDILLRLVQHRRDLDRARNPVAWALRVAANTVTDHHRRRARERRALAAAEAETDPQSPESDRDNVTGEIARCMLPFIHGLPEPYREALLLTDIEGLTQSEAAKRLGLSTPGMKSRVQRGRRKLKENLQRCCAIETDRRGGIVDYRRRPGGCDTSC